MTDPTTLCIPNPMGSQRRRKAQKLKGPLIIDCILLLLFSFLYVSSKSGGPSCPPDSKTPGGPVDGRHFEVLSRLNLHCKNVFDINISSVV